MNRLQFSELKKGMKVIDQDKNIGIVKTYKNIHNIKVKYETGVGGYGIYSIDPQDKDHYDPLYEYNESIQNI